MLAAVIALEIVVFVAGAGDLPAGDPLWYASLAHELARAPAQFFAAHDHHPFVMRIGLTAPLALLYRAFGVSTLITNLPAFAAGLGVVAVVHAAAPTPRAKLFALGFAVTSLPLYHEATVLNADLPCAALVAWSILLLSRDRPAAAMVAWFAAFLVKETALWAAPIWLYALWQAPVRRQLVLAVIVGAALAAGYLVACAWAWGDPFARFAGIDALTYDHVWSMHGRTATEWVARLVWQPLPLLAKLFRALLVPALLAPWLVLGRERIWLVATGAILVQFWFGSSSLTSYSPLPMSARMLTPALPAMIVIAAIASDRLVDRYRVIAALLGASLAIAAVWSITATIARPAPDTAFYAALRAEAIGSQRRYFVACSAPRCESIGAFYFGFDVPPNVTIEYAPAVAGDARERLY